MKFTSILKKAGYQALFNMDIFQEYICLSLNEFNKPLRAFLKTDNETVDITEKHIFLGYKPLIMAVSVSKKDNRNSHYLLNHNEIEIFFYPDNTLVEGNKVAKLILKLVEVKSLDDSSLFVYDGIKGEHNLLSGFYKFTNNLREKFEKRSAGNVNLPGNLYEQVRIAYSIPRIISVITLGNNEAYNMFPTDLHGDIDDKFYINSLRHEGKASIQVSELKKIVISRVDGSTYKDVYALGKNHMKDLRSISNFNVSNDRSEVFNLPLPLHTLEYRELEQIDAATNIGIHKMHVYKIINHKILNSKKSTLAHIHQYYQIWRRSHGMKNNYLIR